MINEKTYQIVFEEVQEFLPTGWDKAIVYLEYGETSYSISFYSQKNGKYTKCFDLPNVAESDLYAAFRRIDKVVSAERKKMRGRLWTNMTMIVESNGQVHTDFDYTDLSESSYKYSKEWKKKYLV